MWLLARLLLVALAAGSGHCRLRDLLPDGAGAALGAAVVLLGRRLAARAAEA